MGFTERERRELLKLRHVTKFVIDRLEECGYGSFEEVRKHEVPQVVERLSVTMDSGAWKPADREKAVEQVLKLARLKSKAAP